MAHDFTLYVKLRDISGEKTTKTYVLNGYLGADATLSFAEALTDATALLADLDNASEAQIVEAGLKFHMERDDPFNTYKNAPLAGSDVTDVAKFTLFLDGVDTEKTAPHAIPAPMQTGFLGTTGEEAHIVDITDSIWTNYFANFAASPGGEPQISDGENVDTGRGSGGIKSAVWGSRAR